MEMFDDDNENINPEDFKPFNDFLIVLHRLIIESTERTWSPQVYLDFIDAHVRELYLHVQQNPAYGLADLRHDMRNL